MTLPGAAAYRLPRRRSFRRRRRRSPSSRAASARRSSSTRARRCSRRWPRYQRGCAGRDAPDLLCDEGELEPGRAAGVRARRLRLRHRLRRRAGARARGRRRPGKRHLLRRRQDARRNARTRSTPACCCFNVESDAELEVLNEVARRMRQARAGQPARQPRRRPEDPPVHLHRPEGQQVRHRARRRRCAAYRRAAALPGLRGGRHRLPHRLADHRRRAVPRRAGPPARPGRGGRGATASRSRTSTSAAASASPTPTSAPPAADALVATPVRAHRRARPRRHRKIMFEPGRSLVGNAGVLLTEVLYLKPRRRRRTSASSTRR